MRAAGDARSLPGPGPGRWVGVSQLVFGGLWLALGFGAEESRWFHISLGVATLAISVINLTLTRTSLDSRGLRPAGRLRRIPWTRISSAYVTTSHTRRGYVGLVVDGRPQPVWVRDPDRVIAQRWTAETGHPATSYGEGTCEEGDPE